MDWWISLNPLEIALLCSMTLHAGTVASACFGPKDELAPRLQEAKSNRADPERRTCSGPIRGRCSAPSNRSATDVPTPAFAHWLRVMCPGQEVLFKEPAGKEATAVRSISVKSSKHILNSMSLEGENEA